MEVQVCQGDKVLQEMQGFQYVEAPESKGFVPHCNIYPHITILSLQGSQGFPGIKGDTVSIF